MSSRWIHKYIFILGWKNVLLLPREICTDKYLPDVSASLTQLAGTTQMTWSSPDQLENDRRFGNINHFNVKINYRIYGGLTTDWPAYNADRWRSLCIAHSSRENRFPPQTIRRWCQRMKRHRKRKGACSSRRDGETRSVEGRSRCDTVWPSP